jgi:lipid-A-disaccharide synthase-like uncharacterized protein
LSPVAFWVVSLFASILMMGYGLMRFDAVILLGQAISYAIYVRNMQLIGWWRGVPVIGRMIAWGAPFLAVVWLPLIAPENGAHWLILADLSSPLFIWGFLGQIVFTLRFVYQWIWAEKEQHSFFPLGFWVLSLIGGLMLLSYAVLRRDPVLLTGQTVGLVAYTRNCMLAQRAKRVRLA